MRTSLEVADIFRSAGPAYRAAHAGHLSLGQLKVMTVPLFTGIFGFCPAYKLLGINTCGIRRSDC